MPEKLYNDSYLLKLKSILSKTFERSIQVLDAKPREAIADIGCGIGDLLLEISKNGSIIYGIDSDEKFLAIAKQKFIENTKANFICCNADEILLPDACLDKIIIQRVLQHIPNQEAVIKECFRLLKPNGTLQIVEPDYLSCSFFMNDIVFERKLMDAVAYKRIPNSYKIRQIPALLKAQGFSIQFSEVHNYIIDSFELANYIIKFDEEVEKGFSDNTFNKEEYAAWQTIKHLPEGQFNMSVNLLLINVLKK